MAKPRFKALIIYSLLLIALSGVLNGHSRALAASNSTGNDCEALLQSRFAGSASKACELYEPGNCGNNTIKVLKQIKQIEGGPALIKNSRVLYIYDGEFQKLRPLRPRVIGTLWTYHVVLDTPYGIIDLDNIDQIRDNFAPTPSDQYFAKMFGSKKILDRLKVVSLPATKLLDEVASRLPVASYFAMTEAARGWVKYSLGDALRGNSDLGIPESLNIRRATPAYYILSLEAHLKYPAVNLLDY